MTTYSFDLGLVRSGIQILGYFSSLEDLTTSIRSPQPGDMYAVGDTAPYQYYCWDAVAQGWVDNGALQGEKGEAGSCWWFAESGTFYSEGEILRVLYQSMSGLDAANADTVKIGDLLLYEGGVYQIYSVSSDGCYCQDKHLSLMGPAGATGPSGAAGKAATIRIGSVSTGEEGSPASVSNVGTETAAVLNFQLPRGPRGIQGEVGETGPRGAAGSPGLDANRWWMASAVSPNGEYGDFYYADMLGMEAPSETSLSAGDLILYNGQVFLVETLYEDFCRASYAGVNLKGSAGADGRDFVILGYYASLSALQSAVPAPAVGAAYGVGSAAPYDIYIWDSVNRRWINNGSIQGPAGAGGEDGATFRPSVTVAGVLSWTNDKGLTNPGSVNIKGPQGEKGEKGDTGDSGPAGPQGQAGPNEVSTATTSSISGLLKGSGGKLSAAAAGTDYLAPGAKGAANGLASLDANSKLSPEQASARIVSVTTSKTLALTDAGSLQKVEGSSARTITIPTNSSAAFLVGTEIEILRYGSGSVTIESASGVTLRCAETTHMIAKQYGGVSLKKLGANEWLLMGNLG